MRWPMVYPLSLTHRPWDISQVSDSETTSEPKRTRRNSTKPSHQDDVPPRHPPELEESATPPSPGLCIADPGAPPPFELEIPDPLEWTNPSDWEPITYPDTAKDVINKCSTCWKEFARPNDLRRHQNKHNLPKFICTFTGCAKPFYRKDKLNQHLLQHENRPTLPKIPKWHKCYICSLVFRGKAELTRHERYHLPRCDRSHKCEKCTKTFVFPKDLRRHKASVHGENKEKFYCPVDECVHSACMEHGGFNRRDHLTRHQRTRHGVV